MGDDVTHIRLDGPKELLSMIPYLLGFHPHNDIVLSGLSDRRFVLTARASLDWPTHDTVDQLTTALAQVDRHAEAIVTGYGPAAVEPKILQIADGINDHGFRVGQTLRVHDSRYFCLRCGQCTPAEGTPFDARGTVAAAHATMLGMVARPRREDVEQLVAYHPEDSLADRIAQIGPDLFTLTRTAARLVIDSAMRVARSGRRLSDHRAAGLVVVLQAITWRDHAWLATTGKTWQLDMWLDLTRRCPPAYAAPVASLAAWCAWRSGDGILARAAVERALETSRSYRLARMVNEALDRHLPPDEFPWPPDDMTFSRSWEV
ncbi:DUF4192 domain-containing protein [Hamadaea sp. NPDC051192]|uniref:DUF4192 domain-containing protein n=1 Tax=Hamadaea sp. NPDC051192 TaxID=3154940 RepID=UPI003443ED27